MARHVRNVPVSSVTWRLQYACYRSMFPGSTKHYLNLNGGRKYEPARHLVDGAKAETQGTRNTVLSAETEGCNSGFYWKVTSREDWHITQITVNSIGGSKQPSSLSFALAYPKGMERLTFLRSDATGGRPGSVPFLTNRYRLTHSQMSSL